MYDLLIRDVTIITSAGRQVADIAVEGDRIAYVGGNPAGGAREEVSGIGRFVIPGVIDTQARMRTPGTGVGLEWAQNSRAAVVGGVTTVLDLPDERGEDASGDRLAAAAAGSVCNYGVWSAATTGGDPWARVADGQAVAPLVQLDAADGPRAVGVDGLRAILDAAEGRLVGVHAELASALVDPAAATHAARPAEAALAGARAVLELCRELDSPVHLTSLTTAAELNLLDPHRGDVPVTTALSPLHLFLSLELGAKNGLSELLANRPPIRPELDRRALWAAIKRGRVDVAASAHLPLSRAAKADGAPGMPGVGMLFPMLMSGVRHGRMSLERLVEMCCEAPARIFGLEGKGVIAEGADADLVMMTEGVTERVTGPLPWGTTDWTPYVGRDAGVAPQLVLVQGRVVARSGVLGDALPEGRQVRLAR